MKKVLLLLLCVLVSASCAGQKNAIKNSTIIEYKAYSRMFYRVISIENQMIYITKSRAEKPVGLRLSNADWNKIKIAIQNLNLESLTNLKAPTEKRLYDGASIAKFKVIFNEKEYQTKSFDHGNPPAEIENIVNKMLSFAK